MPGHCKRVHTELAGPSSGQGSSAPNMLVFPHEPRIAQIPEPALGRPGSAGCGLLFILLGRGIDVIATEMTLRVALMWSSGHAL